MHGTAKKETWNDFSSVERHTMVNAERSRALVMLIETFWWIGTKNCGTGSHGLTNFSAPQEAKRYIPIDLRRCEMLTIGSIHTLASYEF